MSTTHVLFSSVHIATIQKKLIQFNTCNITIMISRIFRCIGKMNVVIIFRPVLISIFGYNCM